MKERTKLGLSVLEAALLVGVLGDALLRATPWGLNVLLWATGLVAAATALLLRRRTLRKGGETETQWLLPAVLLFAAAFAWRDSATLKTWDTFAILGLLGLAAARERGVRVRLAGLTDYVTGVAAAAFHSFFGMFPLVLQDIVWKEIPHKGWTRHVLAVLRGLLIATPLVFIFGALLVAADAIFENLVFRTLSFKPDEIIGHLFLTLLLTWLSGGFLRVMLFGAKHGAVDQRRAVLETLGLTAGIDRQTTTQANAATGATTTTPPEGDHASQDAAGEAARLSASQNSASQSEAKSVEGAKESDSQSPATTDARIFSLGLVETGVVLGLVNLLFAAFVIVQVRYFFGGADWVVSSTGVTYAEYARRGFFELVWVAALVLPMLLGVHALLRKNDFLCERVFRLLAGVQVALLFVIMTSAMKRMRLYQSEYGMTELRLYTTAFMFWLGLVFVWFAATVLRGRRERFAYGALLAGLFVIAGLHFLNPDRFIVNTNAALVREGRSFDAFYAARLSADAVPALVKAMPAMSADEQEYVAARMLDRWSPDKGTDWRTWNWSRQEARHLVGQNRIVLEGLAEIYRRKVREAASAQAAIAQPPPATQTPTTTQTPAATQTPVTPTTIQTREIPATIGAQNLVPTPRPSSSQTVETKARPVRQHATRRTNRAKH